MDLRSAMNRFYADMNITELHLMNNLQHYPHVTYNSLLYLNIIEYKQGCTVSQLARMLHISKPAVTAKVNELLRQGLVVKKQSEQDKRVYHLFISHEVTREFSVYNEPFYRATEAVEKKYTPKQVELFCQMMQDMNGYFAEALKHE